MFSQTRGIVKHDKVNVGHVRRFSRDNSVPSAESLKIMSHLIIILITQGIVACLTKANARILKAHSHSHSHSHSKSGGSI